MLLYDVGPMAQPDFMPTDAVGPIQDPDARRVCSLAGIETARRRVHAIDARPRISHQRLTFARTDRFGERSVALC